MSKECLEYYNEIQGLHVRWVLQKLGTSSTKNNFLTSH